MSGGDGLVARARRAAGRAAREARLALQLARMGTSGPRLAVLPSGALAVGSSRLRGWLMADALRPLGWRTLVLPPQLSLSQRRRVLRWFKPDMLLVQGARHPLNDAALLDDHPYVFDLDDADFEDPELAARLAQLCAQARGVVGGSRHVTNWMARHNDNATVIWTGAPRVAGDAIAHDMRGNLVVWAQADPLGYPLEFALVCDLMLRLQPHVDGLRLRLYGWRDLQDRAPVATLEAAGVTVELRPPMPYEAFVASLRDAAVGLSPICAESAYSRGKSFGKILAYLDARVPVICSDEADHALFFTAESGVVSNDPEVWVREMARLLDDSEARERMADAAAERMRHHLTTEAAAAKLDAFLRAPETMR